MAIKETTISILGIVGAFVLLACHRKASRKNLTEEKREQVREIRERSLHQTAAWLPPKSSIKIKNRHWWQFWK